MSDRGHEATGQVSFLFGTFLALLLMGGNGWNILNGDRLDDSFVYIVNILGSMTAGTLIGNGIYHLSQHDKQTRDRLATAPA